MFSAPQNRRSCTPKQEVLSRRIYLWAFCSQFMQSYQCILHMPKCLEYWACWVKSIFQDFMPDLVRVWVHFSHMFFFSFNPKTLKIIINSTLFDFFWKILLWLKWLFHSWCSFIEVMAVMAKTPVLGCTPILGCEQCTYTVLYCSHIFPIVLIF